MAKLCNSQDLFLKKGLPSDDAYGGSGLGRSYGGGKGYDDGPRRGSGPVMRGWGGNPDRYEGGGRLSRSRTPPPRGVRDRDQGRDRDRDRDRDFFGKGFGKFDKGFGPKGFGKGFGWDDFGGKGGKSFGPLFWDSFKGGKGWGAPAFARDQGFDSFRSGKGFDNFGGKDRGFAPKGWGKDDRGKSGKGGKGGGKGGGGRRGASPEPSSVGLDADLEEYFTGKRPAGSAARELAKELASSGGKGKGKNGPAMESNLDKDLDSYMGRGDRLKAAPAKKEAEEKEKDAKAEGDALAAEADKEVEPKVVGSEQKDVEKAADDKKTGDGGETEAADKEAAKADA